MPTPTEISFYQLGIRLGQCRELRRRCTSPPSSQGFAVTREGLLLLENALADFVSTNNLPANLHRILKSHIRACQRLWKQWSLLPLAQLNDWEIDTSEFDQNLDDLEDHVKSQVGKLAEGRRRLDWFRLGKEICHWEWKDFQEPPSTRVLTKEQIFERARTRPKPRWVLDSSREVRTLSEHIGITVDVLLPKLPRALATTCLLPYNPTQYWPWFSVEAGLKALLGPARGSATQPKAPSDEVPPSDDDDELTKHHLVVDVEHETATLDGTVHVLKSQDCARYLKAILDANGDWVGPRELTEHGLVNPRPDRLHKRLPKEIRILVEIKPSTGSRIPLARLA